MGEKEYEYIFQITKDCDGVYCYIKQGELIRCKDCVKHNKSYGDNGTIDSCPLVLYRGKAQGHEFDYQYCAFAERRTDADD